MYDDVSVCFFFFLIFRLFSLGPFLRDADAPPPPPADAAMRSAAPRRLLVCAFVAVAVCRCIGAPSCSPDKLARYRVTVRTFWTRDRFPKHFPEWRPQAQWTKVLGESV